MTTEIPYQEMSKGETKSIIINVHTPAGLDDDITTYTFTYRWWHSLKGKVLEKTVGAGLTILNQTTNRGELLVSIVKADTQNLAPLAYTQELRMFYGSSEIKIGEGTFILNPSRTIPATVPP